MNTRMEAMCRYNGEQNGILSLRTAKSREMMCRTHDGIADGTCLQIDAIRDVWECMFNGRVG